MVNHLRYPAKRLRSVAPRIEFQDRFPADEGVSYFHPLRNNDIADQRAAYTTELVERLSCMNSSGDLYRQCRGDLKPGIESRLDSLDGGKKTADPPKRKETAFSRYDYLVRGNECVHGQNTERGRAV